ncbi:undecaprenyl-diphosphate phosphatase [Dethiosulfatarculus sandiegensis]|uniref:Undecaprenyl-diphosphatase n=1 Tax=Dethiosulfatarculus sandiegensis TaxID=1429043 RepID=A0A0D2JA61_9BACT|nr:undecaprenyl-diphosphate phosphatase [Dethiosulfatarculus sandiegensis]KIX15009.1 UDP-diphosphatase [Dethiosulfatarculus sandiegensis]
MLDLMDSIWLGLVQGLTEFLPVSSSGHLVLGQKLLGLSEPAILFDVVVHVGTLLAVFACFYKDIWAMIRSLWATDHEAGEGRRLLYLVIVGSVPTALMGFFLKDLFESMFGSLYAVGLALIVTGFLLTATRLAQSGGRSLMQVGAGRALLIGLAQGMAITPGISRSGTTISIGLLLGMDRKLAAHYSFILSIPAIMGALLLELLHLEPGVGIFTPSLMLGGATAAVSGFLALKVLLRVVDRGKLHLFSPYCWALGLAALAWAYFG